MKDNAERLVLGMRRSNLPDWLKNQTLNTLVNVVNNSMYKRDGRVAFSEGQWTCFGTMDQMWLARQIISQLLPSYAWQELNYWARTQMRNGQIHHDFNAMDAGDKREKRSVLVSWDDTEHADYRNIQKWVDLNCGFIISVYEIYKATADRKQFDCLWPYVKKAAQRILVQVEQYGNKQYPFTFDDSENSYDAGGNPNPYNANLSAATYKIMVSLAKEKGETALAATFEHAFNVVKESFHNRYVRDKETLTGKHCESVFAGQWLACHLKLGEIWSVEDTDFILQQLDNYYYPYYYGLGYPQGTYDEWTPYILVHYGGLMLHAGRLEEWYVMQKDAYFRQYLDRNKVFAHPLNILPMVNTPKWISTNIKSKMQYISMPALWRNYYDIIGYHRDARTGELWIKPILHRSMNGRLEDAMFVSPEGCGYIDYEEEQKGGRLSKVVTVKTERPMTVSTLYLADNFKGDVSVSIDGHPCTCRKTGAGYGKEIAIDCHRQITDKGICVIVQGRPEVKKVSRPAIPENGLTQAVSVNPMSPYKVMEAEKADKQVGTQIVQSDGNEYVTSCNNFDYVQFSNVDFSRKGATTFKGRFLGLAENAEVEIVLDDTSGTVIGSCRIPHSAGTWTKIKCPVEKVTGVHNVIVKFYGNHSDDLMNMDWIQFE